MGKKVDTAKHEKVVEESLVEVARRELRKCEGQWTRLSKLTGRKLSYRWLTSFANGDIVDPGATKFLLLCRYIGVKIEHSLSGSHFLKFTPD